MHSKVYLTSSNILLLIILVGFMGSLIGNAYAYSITKTGSGLLAFDSFTTGNTGNLNAGGSATLYQYYEDSLGLHIGVQSSQSGQWVNYYAHPPQANANLYHVTITIPQNSVADGVFNPGLYVEGSDFIPHVGCEAYADDTGYYWEVEYSSNAGQTYTTLYISGTSALPHTQDCTIITNGSNYLKVYIGDKAVFTSSTMNLGMSTPLVTFVQDDTSSSASMHYATFSNYYATSSQNIKVTNNPSNVATVEVVDSTGNVLASSSVTSGTATLNVGAYNFPLSANIDIYDSSNVLIASSPASIYGGDVYSVTNSSTSPDAPTGLSATAASSSQINLSWSAPSSNGGSAITGYKIDRSTDGGSTWNTIVSNTGNVGTTYSDTGLSSSTTYTYQVSAINSVGTSSPSNAASATTSNGGSTTGSIVLNNVQSTSGTVSSSPYQMTLSNFNVGTSIDRLLVVGVSANNNNVASITFGGVPLTQVVSSFNNEDAEFWYLKNPTGTGNVVVTMSGSTSAVVGAYAFSGVNQTQPIPTHVVKHNTSASSPAISITTAYPNDWVLDLPSIYGGSILGSPSCTQEWNANLVNKITGASSSLMVSLPSVNTCSWSANNNDFWDDVALEIKSDTSSGSTTDTSPSAPTGLTAAAGNAQISLSWSVPSSNGGSAITGYNVYRGTISGGENTAPIATGATTTTYTDTGLTNGQTYYYTVKAVNAIGVSSSSNEAGATPVAPLTAPSAPTGLTATTASSSQINLSWTTPSNNGGSAITGYVIQRSTNGGSTWSTIVPNTGTTGTTYSDTGLSSSTTYTYQVSAINSVGTSSPSNIASATTSLPTIKLSQSGLLASDPLNNETRTQQQLQANSGYWTYGGDAIGENASHAFFRDLQGLHVGVQSPKTDGNTWTGFYAVTQNTAGMLFHSIVSTPLSKVQSNPSQYYENGMYVQTFEPGPVNYVVCFSFTSNSTTYWAVASEIGNATEGTQYTPLYVNASANQPLTRDCTIITNGNNYLKVYLDGTMVYNSTSLNLQMPTPFNAYLEPQTNYGGQLLNGTFTNYYATTSENIQINNLSSSTKTVSIIGPSGNMLASTSVTSGTAMINVGKYDFPLVGTIKAYDSSNTAIASTSGTVNIFGGDVYSVG